MGEDLRVGALKKKVCFGHHGRNSYGMECTVSWLISIFLLLPFTLAPFLEESTIRGQTMETCGKQQLSSAAVGVPHFCHARGVDSNYE